MFYIIHANTHLVKLSKLIVILDVPTWRYGPCTFAKRGAESWTLPNQLFSHSITGTCTLFKAIRYILLHYVVIYCLAYWQKIWLDTFFPNYWNLMIQQSRGQCAASVLWCLFQKRLFVCLFVCMADCFNQSLNTFRLIWITTKSEL